MNEERVHIRHGESDQPEPISAAADRRITLKVVNGICLEENTRPSGRKHKMIDIVDADEDSNGEYDDMEDVELLRTRLIYQP